MHIHDRPRTNCTFCGGELITRLVKPGEPERLVCSQCGQVNYQDPKLAGCAIVEIDGKVLLGRRAIDPAKGMWVLPGGFVDRGEVVERAVERELLEETGLIVTAGEIFGLFSYEGEKTVVAVYLAEAIGGELAARDETTEVGLFGPDEIPWPELAFSSTKDALTRYYRIKTDAGS